MSRVPGLVSSLRIAPLLTMLLLPLASASDTTPLVPRGAVWSYLDDGSDQGEAWRAPGFDDSLWASGPAELGYGDGDESTIIGFGPDPADKFITSYFRHTFVVPGPGPPDGASLRLLKDDGAVVYLDGSELLRANMPAGAITHTTLATTAISGSAEQEFLEFCIDPAALLPGAHTLAVEVHQAGGTSSDVSFDLELSASFVTRGPYLQSGTASTMTVRWRTCGDTDSRVDFGPDPDNLTETVTEATLTRDHEVTITDLAADTRYSYSVGTSTAALAGPGPDFHFDTSPVIGTDKPTRIWVIGDSGTANANARAVRDAYQAYAGSTAANLWLMLGDNAYPYGTDEQYQQAVFDMYPALLRTTVLWPTLGNHDAEPIGQSTSNGNGPYFDMFTLPDLAQAGGLASGTEAYYSFDYANIHFINLNSTGSDRSPGSPMLTWLAADLAATAQDWIIAYWHHPPYTHGSHDSDNPLDSGGRMFDMRANVLPILESYGVDLVLSGHSHSYERSYLLDGHYGTSDTLSGGMILDPGNGRPFGDGMYTKETAGPGAHEGAVYSVVGSSGLTSGGPLDHPAMVVALNELGSLILDVDGSRLDAEFIDSNGTRRDLWTLSKGPRSSPVPDIKANGGDGPVVVPPGGDLTVSLSLDSMGYEGDPSDWWLLMLRYDFGSAAWAPFNVLNFPLPILDLPQLDIIEGAVLPSGLYIFYYGVDTEQNGLFDIDQMFTDLVVVHVQ